jgi:ABC-type uncharacterized transport system auxiliary subunit
MLRRVNSFKRVITGIVSALAVSFLFTACISLKSPYPEIAYYRLAQEASSYRNTATIPGTLQVRNFVAIEAIQTDQLLAMTDNNHIEKYYYHRWITEGSQLITDYFVVRLNNMKAFAGGVCTASTVLVPDFILEGEVLDMMAFNAPDDDKNSKAESNVNMSIKITLLKRTPGKTEKEIVLNKVYTQSQKRDNNSVATIPPSFSKCLAKLSDIMMNDIQSAIASYKLNSNKD